METDTQSSAAPGGPPRPAPSVLIVDDRRENLVAMEATLEPLGVDVVRASSPGAALAAVREREFAVILLDVQMPEMDGYEVARRIKSQGTSGFTPIIFVTALDRDREHAHTGYESGAVDYLFKPIDPDVLRAKVQAFVRLHAQREADAARQRQRYAELGGAAAKLAAERRAAAILESITDAFYALDAELRFTYVNRKAEELWGRRREDLLGRRYWDEFPKAADSEWHRLHEQVMTERRAAHFEVRSPVIDRWISVSLYPEAAGGLSCYFQDISARKQVEAEREVLVRELEAQRARLASVFRHAPAFLAVVRGPEHVFELVNDAYYQLVGHRELLGKPVLEALPDIRGQGFESILDSVLQTGEPFAGREVPIALRRAPGASPEERFLDFFYLPLVEADGNRSGVIAYGLDVTDHVTARHEVERARDRVARLQALTAALAGANTPEDVAQVVVSQGVDATGASTGMLALRQPANPGEATVLRTHGFPDGPAALPVRFPVSGGGPAALCMRTGQPVFLESRDAIHAQFADLREVWDHPRTDALATVPLAATDDVLGAISFTFTSARPFPLEDRDFFLTLGRQAALALERARLFGALTKEREAALLARSEAESARFEAEAAAAAKSQFLATMSHELRTPINAQIGYAQLLEMGLAGPLTPEQREYLGRLGRSSEHLLTLVNDVLDLSQIEAGELSAHRDQAATGPVVDAALDITRPLADARGIELLDARPADAGVPFIGDEHRVRQVLVNLLSNAVKFTDRGGRIAVSCGTVARAPSSAHTRGRGPWAWVRVEDTGIGISPDQLGRIFDPFHQVDSGRTRKQGGTGLGLAISRRLARLMGGDLTAESEPGRGSTFTLWLPAPSPAAGDGPAESSAEGADRTEADTPGIDAPGLDEIGELLRASASDILVSYTDRLRADPDLPRARTMRRSELEDHAMSLLADLAQSLVIVADAGPAGADLLRDGSAIQRTIADQHGARRYAQGWSAAAVRRDHQVMRAEIERAVHRQVRARAAQSAVRRSDVAAATRVLLGLVDQAAAVSLRAWERAAEGSRRA